MIALMPKKKKKVIWHKKQSRFIPSASLKGQHPAPGGGGPALPAGFSARGKGDFKQSLVEKIRRAAQNG
jgi:hypothetical protein